MLPRTCGSNSPAKHQPHILRIFSQQKPASVALDGQERIEGSDWAFHPETSKLIIKTRQYEAGTYVIKMPHRSPPHDQSQPRTRPGPPTGMF